MNQFNCIIIEDEPIAAEILVDYVRDIPFLNLIGVYHDAISALEYLNNNTVDLIFLDIHLPKLKGLDFLKSLRDAPEVIITTAYEEYALKSYEFKVLDYLLKPIEFSRFLQAVNKLQEKTKFVSSKNQSATVEEVMHVNVNKKLVKIILDEILYIESNKEYLHIHTGTKEIITKMQINEIEKVLDASKFIRIHRSFIIPIQKADSISLTEIEIKEIKLPVGRNYREQVKKQWKLF